MTLKLLRAKCGVSKTASRRGLGWAAAVGLLFVGVSLSSAQTQVPYRAGDVLSTNFGLQNRFQWTNDNGQIFTPSNTTIRLHDFAGKIVFYCFFDVW